MPSAARRCTCTSTWRTWTRSSTRPWPPGPRSIVPCRISATATARGAWPIPTATSGTWPRTRKTSRWRKSTSAPPPSPSTDAYARRRHLGPSGRSPNSAELHPVALERLVAQLQPEARRLGHGHEAIDDGRALAEELEPQRIARGVGERLQDESGWAGRHRVDVDLGIVMGGQRHLIHLGHDGGLAPGRQPTGPGGVDDEVIDQPLRHHRAQPEGAELRLAGRDGNVGRVLETPQRLALVVPRHGILEPEDVVRGAQLGRAQRR